MIFRIKKIPQRWFKNILSRCYDYEFFVSHKSSFISTGRLSMTPEEYEALKSTLINGQGRWMENEVVFEFIDENSIPAFTKGE